MSHQKNFNEGRPILSAAKCRPMILVSKTKGICGYLLGGNVTYNACYRIPASKLHVSVWNNSISVAYLQSWCALCIGAYRVFVPGYNRRWLHLGSNTRVRSHS